MSDAQSPTLLIISSYFKGEAFIRQAKKEGCRVLFLTEEKLANEKWPRESIDEFFLMPDLTKIQDMINAISYLYRGQWIDQIIALDEYDVENVATLREHLRLPGMGQTQTKFFRDKLAMRMKAEAGGIRVPAFTPVLNYDRLREYMGRVPAPWVLKPRTQASSMGIRKIHDSEELWRTLDTLGDEQSTFVLEHFIPGEVYHVDSLTWDGKVVYASAQRYGEPPFQVYHGGGIFTTRILPQDSDDAVALKAFNIEVIKALGMDYGVTHAEFIKGKDDGQFYFLEIAARVGGAHISDLLEHATGVNPWSEWAKLEIAHIRGQQYQPPQPRPEYGGLLVSLAKQDHPDTSAYTDPEIVWRIDKLNHVGFIVVSESADRVDELLDSYLPRVANDFLAVAPPKEKATH